MPMLQPLATMTGADVCGSPRGYDLSSAREFATVLGGYVQGDKCPNGERDLWRILDVPSELLQAGETA